MLLILNLWNDVLFLRGDHWSPFFCSPITTPQSTLSTAPLYGSLTCLSLRRGGTQCRSGGCYSTSFFCPPITTPQSTLSTAPLFGSLTCLSLRRGGTQCRSGGCYSTSFFTFQHVKASRYGLPYLLICCTCVGCVIRCFLSVTAAETRI